MMNADLIQLRRRLFQNRIRHFSIIAYFTIMFFALYSVSSSKALSIIRSYHPRAAHGKWSRRCSNNVLKAQKRIGIVGGGLAGLSVAYHLLEHSSMLPPNERPKVTVFDQASSPGIFGASAVAGGLLHPFTPRGKLVHLGKEGLEVSNRLIDAAKEFEPECVLREQLYRVALSPKHYEQLVRWKGYMLQRYFRTHHKFSVWFAIVD